VKTAGESFYVLGSAVGPAPYPEMVADFQSIIGREAREQMLACRGKLPEAVVACVGGGSNAIGIFRGFVEDKGVRLIGVEAGGEGLSTGRHAATLSSGRVGTFHGMRSYFLQDDVDELMPVYSISAGLDYPGVGPEHAYLCQTGRAEYASITDREALDAFLLLCRTEGIIPAIESAHAVAYGVKLARQYSPEQAILINLSGRGDKDAQEVALHLERYGMEV